MRQHQRRSPRRQALLTAPAPRRGLPSRPRRRRGGRGVRYTEIRQKGLPRKHWIARTLPRALRPRRRQRRRRSAAATCRAAAVPQSSTHPRSSPCAMSYTPQSVAAYVELLHTDHTRTAEANAALLAASARPSAGRWRGAPRVGARRARAVRGVGAAPACAVGRRERPRRDRGGVWPPARRDRRGARRRGGAAALPRGGAPGVAAVRVVAAAGREPGGRLPRGAVRGAAAGGARSPRCPRRGRATARR